MPVEPASEWDDFFGPPVRRGELDGMKAPLGTRSLVCAPPHTPPRGAAGGKTMVGTRREAEADQLPGYIPSPQVTNIAPGT
jgi:hypothetical protein